MNSINIYTLTRITDNTLLRQYERQLSKRAYFLQIKAWEIDGLRKLAERLTQGEEDYGRVNFFYSYQLGKLGKEFDLLQISEGQVINIELKSGNVTDEKIRKQLILNRQYLSLLGRDIHAYTYISEEDRLVRLTNSSRLVDAEWEELRGRLAEREVCVKENIEDLFREEQYLISPFREPDRFLRREYFLTAQQRDIKSKILKNIEEKCMLQGFTGLPGTGKTLLLLDIAMQLSYKEKVCVIHAGNMPAGMERLDELLKRIDFIRLSESMEPDKLTKEYAAILIDEGQRMEDSFTERLFESGIQNGCPIIVSYDSEEVLCREERESSFAELLSDRLDFKQYCLTNRIRTNPGLSNFVQSMMKRNGNRRKGPFAGVETVFADNMQQSIWALREYIDRGYVYIENKDSVSSQVEGNTFDEASRMEYDKVVVVADEQFFYDEKGFLRSRTEGNGISPAGMLYHGCSRAKKELAVIVQNNTAVFAELMNILQGKD